MTFSNIPDDKLSINLAWPYIICCFTFMPAKKNRKEVLTLLKECGLGMVLKNEPESEDEGESQDVLLSQKLNTLSSADGKMIQPVVDEFQEKVKKVRTVKKDEVNESIYYTLLCYIFRS